MAEDTNALIAEKQRLRISNKNTKWKKWGPYMTDRQWGTVREDYSPNGNPWDFISHDMARSNAYRWGEEGIAGFCDAAEILCLAPAFWNGKDPILKERLFGLTNGQGNHGEDVKELYYHLDSSPTHSYTKFLYKYPHAAFPYDKLLKKNQRSKDETEFEIVETGIFDNSRYFDIFIEHAKADTDDILMKITVHNRGATAQEIHVIPHLFFRNFWKHNPRYSRPGIKLNAEHEVLAQSIRNGKYYMYFEDGDALFCENETNNVRIYRTPNDVPYVKDGINDHIIEGLETVNPEKNGTKCGIWYQSKVASRGSVEFRIRLSKKQKNDPWKDFNEIFSQRIAETDEFYDSITPKQLDTEQRYLLRKSFAGLLWTKQFYYLDVFKWLNGGPGEVPPVRHSRRNESWTHLTNRDIISMPDKWEYPWYAAWDLAFHATTFAEIDTDFAKDQLLIMLKESYMNPNGQIPAYEWNFSDVNPPVHSWAVVDVYEKDKKQNGGIGDRDFLEKCFQKLLINFTWWVNQKDSNGNSLFDGGFLGLDNIGVFDRSNMPKGIRKMQQADATSWMAMFSLDMLRMSVELASFNKAYEESAAKFFRHFLNIGWAMHHIGKKNISLWDDLDAFYYDVVEMDSGVTSRLRVRSLVGIIPLFAIEIIHKDLFNELKDFKNRVGTMMRTRPDLAALISRIEEDNENGDYLFSIMRGFRLEHLLKRMLDENEFLSDYGIRSLSKYHEKYPFVFEHHGRHVIKYESGESRTNMFGGNSNWRGPIWLPLNYLIIQSLRKYYQYYGDTYVYEFPTGSGKMLNLKEIAHELTLRLLKLFERDDSGKYHYHTETKNNLYSTDIHFKDLHLFYEFFDGDSGRGLGASHQTGWTALISNLLLELEDE
ncbi:MGH1-like glycoside hydrolase domain-containing protein [Portibacter marinus]|uniref:MGH1-like glycoside hydrolase domain-containing protein n=1 Tax=Portibacter marinus TaxID=2898660 RepID=UPI001F3660EE|nr:glucosidase [Portibacter marinus]